MTYPRTKPKLLSGAQYVRKAYPAKGDDDEPPQAEDEEDSGDEICETAKDTSGGAEDSGEAEFHAVIVCLIRRLRKTRLINLSMLVEAWPTEYTAAYEEFIAEKTEFTTPAPPAIDDSTHWQVIPSLADLTVKPAVEHALNLGDVDDIKQLIWLPGKAKLIKDTLRSQKPLPESAIGLLGEVISHDLKSNSVIDLSSFHLTSVHIVQIFSDNTFNFSSVEGVNLSHCRLIADVAAIRAILTAIPTLKNLNLLDTDISVEDIRTLIVEEYQLLKCLSTLTHPALLRISNPITHQNGFSAITLRYSQESAYLPIWTPAIVIQSLIDFFSPVISKKPEDLNISATLFKSMALQVAFSSLRDEKRKWGRRRVPFIAANSTVGVEGAGWVFAYNAMTAAYAFVEIGGERLGELCEREEGNNNWESAGNADTDKWKLYDFTSFLEKMAVEGRPLPSHTLVHKFEGILATLPPELVPDPQAVGNPIEAMLGRMMEERGFRRSAHVFEYKEFARFRSLLK